MTEHERILAAYFQLMNMSGASHVYREVVRSGLLWALLAEPATAEALARQCGTSPEPTRLLLDVLVPLGLIERDGDRYRATMLAFMLVSGGYKNLGDEYWAHLPALLRTGQPLVKMDEPAAREAHYQGQAAALGWMLTPAAECAADLLAHTLPADAAILDVGAGSGVWSLSLAHRRMDVRVTAIDWPAVLAIASENFSSLRLKDRLATIAGNYHDISWPAGQFDVVILGNVTHLETEDGNRALFAKARQALKPHGRLVIFDVFPGQPQGELNRALYVLGLALRTERGHVYSAPELERLLAGEGFSSAPIVPLAVHPYIIGMLVATA